MLIIILIVIGIGIYSLMSAIIVTQDDTDWLDNHPAILLLLQPGFLLFCFFATVSIVILGTFFSGLNWIERMWCKEQKEVIFTGVSPIGRDFARKVTEIHNPVSSSKKPGGA